MEKWQIEHFAQTREKYYYNKDRQLLEPCQIPELGKPFRAGREDNTETVESENTVIASG